MNYQVEKTLKQKGYSAVYPSINQSIRDLKQARYTRGEILDTLYTIFGDNGILTRYIHKNIDLIR